MLRTSFTDLLGVEWPIVRRSGMGGVARAPLAAAVSEAGGLGTIAYPGMPPPTLCAEIRRRADPHRAPARGQLPASHVRSGGVRGGARRVHRRGHVLLGDVRPHVAAAHAAGVKVGAQVGSADEAATAADAGVDFVVAQGVEAGGHVRGTTSTLVLVPRGRRSRAAAAGGGGGRHRDARGIVAVLAAGADAAALGTRFMLTPEASVHRRYREALGAAGPEDTVLTTLSTVDWRDAPHRVLRTATVRAWERRAGRRAGRRPGEASRWPPCGSGRWRRRSSATECVPPMDGTDGDADALCFYAGQSCGRADAVDPPACWSAGSHEAAEIIRRRLAPLAT